MPRLACLAVLLVAPPVRSASAQAPACLGAFRAAPVAVAHGEPIALAVDGDDAVVVVNELNGFPSAHSLHAFQRIPGSSQWFESQSVPYAGATAGLSVAAVAGRYAALVVAPPGSGYELALFERDTASRLWRQVDALPFAGTGLQHHAPVAMSAAGRLARAGFPDGRIEVWEPSALGWTRTAQVPAGTAYAPFAFDGERLAFTRHGDIELWRRTPGGAFQLEVTLNDAGDLTAVALDGDRLWCRVRTVQEDRLSVWRLFATGGATTAQREGSVLLPVVAASAAPNAATACAAGTFIARRPEHPCAGLHSQSDAAFAVLRSAPEGGDLAGGELCAPPGPLTAPRVLAHAFDGRTLACVLSGSAAAQPRPVLVQFAALLGADLDRDGDCTEDAREIAADPTLDRNANGRLDATESRGAPYCVPAAPQPSGAFARLSVVGTDGAASQDLAAVVSGVRPGALVLALVAPAPAPLPAAANAPHGLCLGDGPVGDYPVRSADTTGATVTPLHPGQLPFLPGAASALPGQTWAWQGVVRDGAALAVTNAVAVTLW